MWVNNIEGVELTFLCQILLCVLVCVIKQWLVVELDLVTLGDQFNKEWSVFVLIFFLLLFH